VSCGPAPEAAPKPSSWVHLRAHLRARCGGRRPDPHLPPPSASPSPGPRPGAPPAPGTTTMDADARVWGCGGRMASGMCADFNPKDSSFYIVGTEEGSVHRCSVSYNEQVRCHQGCQRAWRPAALRGLSLPARRMPASSAVPRLLVAARALDQAGPGVVRLAPAVARLWRGWQARARLTGAMSAVSGHVCGALGPGVQGGVVALRVERLRVVLG
jgi:hypothetical protein